MKKIFLLTIFSFVSSLVFCDIVLSVSPGQTPPYIIGDHSNPTGGVLYDLAQELSKELKEKVSFENLSKNRSIIALLDGKTTAICISNIAWFEKEDLDKLIFSEPLFTEKNVFVVRTSESKNYTSINSFFGKTVGAASGYFYAPAFSNHVESGRINREDVDDPELNFKKILTGRIDAFIFSDVLFYYAKKNNRAYLDLTAAPYVLSSYEISFAFSKKNKEQADKINKALIKLKKAGIIDKILAKYN